MPSQAAWRLERLAARHGLAFVVLVGIVHRTTLFVRFHHILTGLAGEETSFAVVQLLPLPILRSVFWRALWVLQETPPVPHAIARMALSLSSWPFGVAQLLCAFNGCLSIVTAALLFIIVRRATCLATAGLIVSFWFLLSTDLAVLEYVFFGQAFYENLGMCCVTGCCALLPAAHRRRGVWAAAGSGILAALAALTRASLSFFALVPAAILLAARKPRLLAAYLAPVLLLQGGWALKNSIVFGTFAWETSTWSGFNAAKGLGDVIGQQKLCDDVLASMSGTYPDWFIATAKACPTPFFNVFDNGMPYTVQQQDTALRAWLGVDLPANSVAARMRSNEYRNAVVRFAVNHPAIYARRLLVAYTLLWQRIGDYGARFWAPLFIEPEHRGVLDLPSRGFGETQRVMLSRPDVPFVAVTPVSRPAFFATVSLAPLDAVSIVTLHCLFPFMAVADLWRRSRRQPCVLSSQIWLLAGAVGYGLLVFSAVEVGENMRFRLAIEPAILALTAACLTIAAQRGWSWMVRLCEAARQIGASELEDEAGFLKPRATDAQRP